MNKHLHRLVFSRRHGMRMAVSETARATGKAAGGEARTGGGPALALALAAASSALYAPAALAQARAPVVFASKLPAASASLPRPYGSTLLPGGSPANGTPRPFAYDPAKGNGSADLATTGRVTWRVDGTSATFDQGSVERVVVNWDSFDIGAGYKVHFSQNKDPAKYVSALNRIWSADPTQIFGSLTADREVILLNANGVYFGRGARVDTGKFVATSLSIADSVFEKGLRNVTDASAVFGTGGADYRPTNLDSGVTVEGGAELRSAAGGDVLLVAPRVVNQGRIETPSGQAVLAAGDKVYLMSSSDPRQRGLIVAVDPIKVNGVNDSELGIAENAASGSYKTVNGATVSNDTSSDTAGLALKLNEIRAESGTVNLVGLTVRQKGTVNATTAVKGANGAIYLQAMGSTAALVGGTEATTPSSRRGLVVASGGQARVGALLGTVEVGAGSVTAVRPSTSTDTQIDAETFNPSRIRVEGAAIHVASHATMEAPAGRVELLAAQNSLTSPIFDSGLTAIAAGANGSRIVVSPDASISVAGVRGVEVDGVRNQGAQRLFRIELADAPVQRDGPLYRAEVFFDLRDGGKITAANVAGAAAAVARTAQERSTVGGTLRLEAEGAVVVGEGATLDVSGGTVQYSEATLQNSLVERNGVVTLFKTAGAGVAIDRVLGQTQTTLSPAYTEGRDGGTMSVIGRKVALAGQINGQVLQGERQRDGTSARATASAFVLGRELSSAYYLDAIEMGDGAGLLVDPGILANPLGGSLTGLSAAATLSLPAIRQGGFGALQLRAGSVSQLAPGTLDLGIGGKLDVRADTIDLAGSFLAPGGAISLATVNASLNTTPSRVGDIHIGGDAVLQTAGLWTNDTAAANPAGTEPAGIQLGGGQVTVNAARTLSIDAGATIDVSGGARLAANGAVSRGSAGSITLGTGRSERFESSLAIDGAHLRGLDFSAGGSLTINAPQLALSNGMAEGFVLAPEFFSSGGFGNIAVSAFGDVRVAAGTVIHPVLQNWQFAAGYRSAASGPMRDAVAAPVQVDEQLAARSPVHLSLDAGRPLNPGIGLAGSSLVVERGAEISLEPGGRLTLTATRNMAVGASGGTPGAATVLSAPGGQIKLGIVGPRGAPSATTAEQDSAGFLPDQVLWVGTDAHLSADGTALLRPDAGQALFAMGSSGATAQADRKIGTVFGGGSITLEAQRGYVVAEAGSSMSVDGTAAELNLPGLPNPVRLAKSAGSVKVSSPEGFVLDGTISARAPRDATGRQLADGGLLDLSLGLGGVYTATSGNLYPGALVDRSGNSIPGAQPKPRQLLIDEYSALVEQRGATLGGDLASSLDNGTGYVPVALLRDAGFDALQLGAGDRLRFDTSVSLRKPLRIGLDAPAVAGLPGVEVSLSATHIALGDTSPSHIGLPANTSASMSGDAITTLHLQAPSIEVLGNSGLQGFTRVLLDAGPSRESEVRLSALTATNLLTEDAPRWTLNFAGELDITAGQIYAGTGARFTLQGAPAIDGADPGSRLTFRTALEGAAPTAPLSVFGTLTANATDIVQAGVLRQPFGAILLNAERSLTLGDGSVTSVSGAGMTRIYGETTNLSQWLAGTSYATSLPVDKSISLKAKNLTTASTATVDAAGGGDIQAWEFFPGVGGTKDYFQTAGLYAVLPDYADAASSALNGGPLDSALRDKQIVITMDGGGLRSGSYTLLPARYALLADTLPNGAFLVRRASDQGKTVLGAVLPQDDGSAIVSGYMRDVGSRNVGVPGERFVIEPAATFAAKSEIRLTGVSDLLQVLAGKEGLVRPPLLPRDAGRVQVAQTGSERSTWQASVRLDAQGGRAGLFDVSAPQLALVDDLAKTPAGALGIAADVVTESGAGSVLLGGKRSAIIDPDTGSTTWLVDQSGTSALTVDLGKTLLTVEELILTAGQSLNFADGTKVRSTATGTLGASTLTTMGDGVLVVVGANPVDTSRTGSALKGGDLTIGASSQLEGAQVTLDATGSLHIDPSVTLPTRALEIGAQAIVIGGGTKANPHATLLSGDLLATARDAPSLTLRSYSTIDFVGDQNWSQRPTATAGAPDPTPVAVQERLVLDAPAVRGMAKTIGAAARTDIAAQSITLRNSSGRDAPDLPSGQGQLVLQAVPPLTYGNTGGLTIGPGTMAIGYEAATLRSTGDIVIAGSGGVTSMQDLTLSAARVTAAVGADQTVKADFGTLRIAAEAGSRTLGERVGQGAALKLSARTVQQQGVIDLPGGNLTIEAQGGNANSAALTFGAGSMTSVSGFTLGSDQEFEAFGHAGSLSASAALGRIELWGTLDASAARRLDGSAGNGDAGRISLHASGAGGQILLSQPQADGSPVHGALLASAGSATVDHGGQLDVDVTAMVSLDALADRASKGGITGAVTVRVRTGDVSLDHDIAAQRIVLSADSGTLKVGAATLDAASDSGGVVQLAAGGDLRLGPTARIDARSQRSGANGGDVLLTSTAGRVQLAAGTRVDAGGDDTQDGRIVLRAQRGADDTTVNVDALDTSRLMAGEVDIEAVRTYGDITRIAAGSSSGNTLGQATVRDQNAGFMNARADILGALGVAATEAGRVNLRAGVEVRSGGDLTVNGDWQLANDRPGGDAGFLTLRAAGDLNITSSISDGFSSATSTGVINDNPRSWSYRLAAGADLSSANPLAVNNLSEGTTGNLGVAAGKLVRTGAGSIEMAAGRDILLAAGSGSDAQGMAYVSGRRMEGAADVLTSLFSRQTVKPILTEHGGRMELDAVRDIASPEAKQLINNWFWRSGLQSTRAGEEDLYSTASQLAWWSEFSRFQQTVGSFGGGNMRLVAGHDIVNMQAMVPTIGWADSTARSRAELEVRNGGDLRVTAGHDVLGGQFLVGRGEGSVTAGGSIAESIGNARLQAPAFALMDGRWQLAARKGIDTAGAFNPTAMSVSSADNRSPVSNFFYTWGDGAALNLNANAGAINLLGMDSTQVQTFGLATGGATPDFYARVMPATLQATAASADVNLFKRFSGGGLLFPSTTGKFDIWSGHDVAVGGTGVVGVAMADSDPNLWPDAARPLTVAQASSRLAGAGGLIATTLTGQITSTGLHKGDSDPARISAHGSIDNGTLSTLLLPKPAHISAGEDILALHLVGQNLDNSSFTSITAGRNFLAGLTGKVEIGGPGTLEISAGHLVDLGVSGGVTTIGNQRNANLPAQGASVKLSAATEGVLDVATLQASYLQDAAAGGSPRAPQYRDMLLSHVQTVLASPGLTYDQALAQFQAFPAEAQAAFGRQVQAAEFGARYLAGATPDATQMTTALRVAFNARRAEILKAGDAALASGATLTLPGREVLQGAAIASYLGELRALSFDSLDLDSTVAARVASLAQVQQGWRDTVAASLGSTTAALAAMAAQSPQAPAVLAYQAALQDFTGQRFLAYRDAALASEIASTGAVASQFGRKSLPMRLALFDQGFQAAELAGAGSMVAQAIWQGAAPLFAYTGSLDMTQSSVVTERDGSISLVNAGGAINVGLKENASGGANAAKGVITLGGGDVFGLARDDFQVNTQRVFVVGTGDMNIWSSGGDIDSGRGANTAVAAPPLAARRSVDGVVFELPATTTGSGLGILEDASGQRAGTIGLYPAFGEILALDAFIRAPSVIVGASVKGADNLQSAKVGGAAAPVSAPALAVAPPSASSTASEKRSADAQGGRQSQQEARQRNSLLTVDLLGLGPAPAEEECSVQDAADRKCTRPVGK